MLVFTTHADPELFERQIIEAKLLGFEARVQYANALSQPVQL